MEVDPLASIRPWPTVVTLGGSEFTVPAYPAARWLEILLAPQINTLTIVPGLLEPADQEIVTDMMVDDQVTMEDLSQTCLDVITVVSGRSWWWSLNVLALLVNRWPEMYGQMVGPDLEVIPLGAFLDRAYFFMVRYMEADKRRLFDMELEQPPENVEVEIDEDVEGRAFMKMMQEAGQGSF